MSEAPSGPLLTLRSLLQGEQQSGDTGLDSRALTAFVFSLLGLDRLALVREPDLRLSEQQARILRDALEALKMGRSPARILGRREFWSLEFELSEATLEPRPETELLVELALEELQALDAPLIADLGTGSGCILLSILSERTDASGWGLDLSAEALVTAEANAERLGLARRARFVQSNWFSALATGQRFDLLVSNPPYISRSVVDGLPAIVRDQDPRLALEGGEDGLEAYRILAREAAAYLRPGGAIILEIGYDQQDSVGALFEAEGWRDGRCYRDLAGQPRSWLWRAGGV